MADEFITDIFVASEIGYLKAVDVRKNAFDNIWKPTKEQLNDNKTHEICAMCWKNSQRTQMLLGFRNGTVKNFDVEKMEIIDEKDCDVKNSHFTGLFYDRSLTTCTESGVLRTWTDAESPVEIKVGNHISRMRYNRSNPNIIGTGGKENDLKIWDLEKSENIFKAKNVRNDSLDLRVPVWVTDLGFLPVPGLSKVVTGTGYHQIRLYDTAAKKRPVFSMDFEDCPISSVCVTSENSFIVGNTAGTMSVIDLRKGQSVGYFKGFAGGIRCIEHCQESNHVAACGLDRFLRVFDGKSRMLVQKVYLKTKLNSLLFASTERRQKVATRFDEECDTEKINENNNDRKRERTEIEDQEEDDKLWDSMEVVQSESRKHKPQKDIVQKAQKSKKKKTKN